MSIKEKMNHRFGDLQGGLFTKVTKADVGENVGNLIAQGYTMMSCLIHLFPLLLKKQ